MKKFRVCPEITCLNGASFRVEMEAVRGGRLDVLLEETLSQAFGGDGFDTATCTEFTCNVYAPPPPLGG